MRNYQCKKCGTVITSDGMPSVFNCPSGSTHQWTNLGDCGDTPYQCKKCGTVLYSRSMPAAFNCPSGSIHQWTKLR